MLNDSNKAAIKCSLNWFKSFIHKTDYVNKLQEIENTVILKQTRSLPLRLEKGNLIIGKNTIAWYLFLMEVLLNNKIHKYEFYQGARILPLFIKIGNNINHLNKIEGIEEKVRELWKQKNSPADSYLFEILVALTWKKKGWSVEFLEVSNTKQPDLRIYNNSDEFYIECKRQMKTSNYSYKEYNLKQKMVSVVAPLLLEKNLLLEIDFLKELKDYSPTFLLERVNYLINSNLFEQSNDDYSIKISNIDVNQINQIVSTLQLSKYNPYFNNLILNEAIDGFEFSCGIKGTEYQQDGGMYLEQIHSIFGVKARSLSKEAINAKARAISSLIQDAKKQLDSKEKTILHVLIETVENDKIIEKQKNKILEKLDIGKIDYFLLHTYKSFPTSNQLFVIEENLHEIKNRVSSANSIGTDFYLIN